MPFDASERDGYVFVRSVRAIGAGVTLICRLPNGHRVGIPLHAIAAWSDVRTPGDFGALALKRDVAESLGLVVSGRPL